MYEILLLITIIVGIIVGAYISISVISSDNGKYKFYTEEERQAKLNKKKLKKKVLSKRAKKEKSIVDTMCETYNIDEKTFLDEQRELVDKDFEYLNEKH